MQNKEKDFWDLLSAEVEPLGRRRQSALLMIVGAGFLVFLAPLITTNPPVLSKSRWSLLDLAWPIGQLELPVSHAWSASNVLWLLDPLCIFILLVSVLAAVFFGSCSNALR